MVSSPRLIRKARIFGTGQVRDLRIRDGRIAALGKLSPADEQVVDAEGTCLLPALHDHHIHLPSYAASLTSSACGPPGVDSEEALIHQLDQADSDGEWLRGVGYHESVAGDIDRHWLDAHGPDRPIRIQHRSGRLWIINTAGMAKVKENSSALGVAEKAALTPQDGRLFDLDELLGKVLGLSPPDMDAASRQLASYGVTAINDMTPGNGPETWRWFESLQREGALRQTVAMSGRASLGGMAETGTLLVGARKIHLLDDQLPRFEELVDAIRAAHEAGRGVAVHCVTNTALVFTLSALQTAGSIPGDRIEHASVVEPDTMQLLRDVGAGVVTQPNFITERGDTYFNDIPREEHENLYRCASFETAGIRLAFGTDAPFGDANPWAAMRAAVLRQTANGNPLTPDEKLGARNAVNAFLGSLDDPFVPRQIKAGAPADFCLLDRPWEEAVHSIDGAPVGLTVKDGNIIHQRPGCFCIHPA